MKQLKRLNLKKSTTLNDAEMKEILGGGVGMIGPTCAPCGQEGLCKVHPGDPGVWGRCTPTDVGGRVLCYCVATPAPDNTQYPQN